jgi:hypothetical protein
VDSPDNCVVGGVSTTRTRRRCPVRRSVPLPQEARRLSQPRATPPLLAPSLTSVPEADREVLAAAAKGDEAALEKTRPYLEQRRYQDRWGNPAYAARCWLVRQAVGVLEAKA